MEASSTLENIRPPDVSRWIGLSMCNTYTKLLEVTMSCYTVIFILELSVDNLQYS